MCYTQSRFKALISACVMSLIATAGWSQSLTWLGVLPGGGISYAHGVSADGSVVVGWATNADRQRRAFRWTVDGRMQDLGTLGGPWSTAYAVSADGSVVVGWADYARELYRAFRWQNGVMQDLGTLGGAWSAAYAVSADGAVVVGWARNALGQLRAFRWTASDGMQNLGTFPDGYRSYAHDVSADGTVVVGWAENAAWQPRAFRWTASGGMQDLGTLPGGCCSEAYGVSADGSVVVGRAKNAAREWRAFRWTASGGMQNLGLPPGYDDAPGYERNSEAWDVSADGSVVVGGARNDLAQFRAFRWTASRGMEDLNRTYASLLTPGSVLEVATATSPDGRYIVGQGYNAATRRWEAFLLDTGPRCTAHNGDVDANGCVDDADLLAVLLAFGQTGSNLGRVDVNCDGVVDDADLLIVLFNFGSGC
jgi:probable HAF family extracellular repeat protein